jgi:DNA-3-methyladenine glycosylase
MGAKADMAAFLDLLEQDVVAASEAMLGMFLVRGGRRGRIVETEAYRASDDPASHAYRGVTPRNAVMFGPSGLAYVYFSYGAHWMLNIVAQGRGDAAAILVRACEPVEGIDVMWQRRPKARKVEDLLSGPGKLAPAFDITRADNGADLFAAYRTSPPEALPGPSDLPPLHIEPGEPPRNVIAGPRIGIAEGKGHETPWRFRDAGRLKWTSGRRA